jgi:hypothetical protein
MAGQTLTPFLLKDVSLTMRPKGTTGATQEFRCQLSQAELVPSAASGGGASLATFCDTFTDPGGDATWVLTMSGFQAWKDVTDFAMVAFDHEGEEYEFVLAPMGGTISATNPGFKGIITLIPVNVGGTANQYAVFTTSQPVSGGKPTKITAPVVP